MKSDAREWPFRDNGTDSTNHMDTLVQASGAGSRMVMWREMGANSESSVGPPALIGWVRRRRNIWIGGLGSAILVVVLHAAILEGIASVLVADASAPSADVVLILGGDRSYDKAAELVSGNVQSVLLPRSRPGRLERLGIYEPWEKIGRRELTAREVPNEKILIIPGEATNGWHRARLIDEWLRSHPGISVIVLTARFGSAAQSYVFDHEIGPTQRSRITFDALADRRYDETNWWRSKTGIKAFFRSSFSLIYTRVRGEEPDWVGKWDPDRYEDAAVRPRQVS